MNAIQTKMVRMFHKTNLIVKKNSPEILLVSGLVGGVVAAVLAAKATLKAQAILDEHKTKMDFVDQADDLSPEKYTEEMQMKDRVTVYLQTGLNLGRLYAPALSIGTLAIIAILKSHGIMTDRQASLIAAYNLLSEGFLAYRNRVVDELGADTDHQYFHGIAEAEVMEDEEANENGEYPKMISKDYPGAKSIYSRFFDDSNPNFTGDRLLNKAFLMAQQNYANDLLTLRGYVFLNEVYERLGIPLTPEGQLVGWVLKNAEEMKREGRDGYISFGLDNPTYRAGREFVNLTNPSVLLDFNVDGIVYDLI